MATTTRTIILGLDGLDASLCRQFMRGGLMPHLTALSTEGRFHEVLSTTPAESAVAWSCFARCANPGQVGIFDFVEKSPPGSDGISPASGTSEFSGGGGYLPRVGGHVSGLVAVAPSSAIRWSAVLGSGAVVAGGSILPARKFSRRAWLQGCMAAGAGALGASSVGWPLLKWWPQDRLVDAGSIDGKCWWDVLANYDQRTVVLKMPMTYPAKSHANVRLLCGLGVPDLLGTNGKYSIVGDSPGNHQKVDYVLNWNGDLATAVVQGPPSALDATTPSTCSLQVRRIERALEITCGAQTVRASEDRWSSWLSLRFISSPLSSEYGVVRFRVLDSRAGQVRIYMTPIDKDPQKTQERGSVSAPESFAGDLCNAIGRFRTIGWETQTSAFVDGVLDENAYLADVLDVMSSNEQLLINQLGKSDWHNLVCVIQATDQASHMWFNDQLIAMRQGSEIDPTHPLVEIYRRADDLIGKVQNYVKKYSARLVVMSDHGFAPYRRSLHLNRWLAQRGWLALKDRTRFDGETADSVLDAGAWNNVNWFNTRAYALGLAGIYLNVQGRDPAGIVKPNDEYEYLQDRLRQQLLAYRDPSTGQPVISNVYRKQDIYQGSHVHKAPDLVLGLHCGHRVSSATVVGGIPAQEMADQRSHWCGDHCGIEASSIPGICVSNFKTDWPASIPIAAFAPLLWPQLSTKEAA